MNMALDEALLAAAADAEADAEFRPTLRIYQWARPTLSLGYFQAAEQRQSHRASRACDLVRRPSGGGAILHDRELTYALVLPAAVACSRPSAQWYVDVHRGLIAAIRRLTGAGAVLGPVEFCAEDEEPFLCFQRTAEYDVFLDGCKIAGSAQRRRRGAVLQHGSVLLRRSPLAPELPGVCDVIDADLAFGDLAAAFTLELANLTGLRGEAGEIADAEHEAAQRLEKAKYAADAWTFKR